MRRARAKWALRKITDNKINKEQVKALSTEFKDKHPKMYNMSMEIMESCAQETDTDECVAAKKIMDCVTQRSEKARGELIKKAFVLCMNKTRATAVHTELDDKIMKVIEDCAKETDTDECVAAKKIMGCIKEGAEKNGITKLI
ncbi:hypothetical protein CBL_05467 [Carabus blaptoides fortunei]